MDLLYFPGVEPEKGIDVQVILARKCSQEKPVKGVGEAGQ